MDNLQAGVTATPLAADAGAIATTTGRWTTRPSFRLSWRRSFRHGLPVLSSSVHPARRREPRAETKPRRERTRSAGVRGSCSPVGTEL